MDKEHVLIRQFCDDMGWVMEREKLEVKICKPHRRE
jgi:hypothetical protein